ncbi:MAG: ribonuclease PH, partial [Verrucomicrobia bacterium]|nr:ribonuclease PH [Verrucomicrobiota bacterium]
IDCDVLQADGGTRTASITGGYVALSLALAKLQADGLLLCDPIVSPIAAVSVGVVGGVPILDLPYVEDVSAEVDMNLVMNANGEFIELQGTGEKNTFTEVELTTMLAHGRKGVAELLELQKAAIAEG